MGPLDLISREGSGMSMTPSVLPLEGISGVCPQVLTLHAGEA